MKEKSIQYLLYAWYKENARELPWRNTRDPYRIWLSEIILQQTRVEQGLPYYQRFVERFPKVEDLAAAPEDEVLKLWQGLGYYSRARNLHKAAKQIADSEKGFPNSYRTLLELPGVGAYTAAAIASFAYDESVAVVDGNVFRVLSRLYGVDEPIDKPSGKRVFTDLAENLIGTDPALHNQAMMEFGALYCVPKNPDCMSCPIQTYCEAFDSGTVQQLPVKAGKTKVKRIHHTFLHVRWKGRTYLQKRDDLSIWKNLYQFPLIETEEEISPQNLQAILADWQLPDHAAIQEVYQTTHILSHRKIMARFFLVDIPDAWVPPKNDIFELDEEEVQQYAIPRLIDRYLENYYVSK